MRRFRLVSLSVPVLAPLHYPEQSKSVDRSLRSGSHRESLMTAAPDSTMPSVSPRVAWRDQSAAQLVEFAVALPLLVVFVVGIFDFSGAYTLKQKLTNITRDAARVAAAGPATDLISAFNAGSAPDSVVDAFNVVDNYLAANQISDCGVKPSSVTSVGT